jgi:uncharacterized protein (DUF1501 family)
MGHCKVSLTVVGFNLVKSNEIILAAKTEYAFGHSIRIDGGKIVATAEGTFESGNGGRLAKRLGSTIFAANEGSCVVEVRVEDQDGHDDYRFDENNMPY